MITGLIVGGICAAIILATIFFVKKLSGSGSSTQFEELKATVKEQGLKIAELISASTNVATSAQLETVSNELAEVESAVAEERNHLSEAEAKLETAQVSVQEREKQQQETKTIKEEDEDKLTSLLSQYGEISSKSVELEQQLAESLKHLDQLMATVKVDSDQKAALQEISDVLTTGGSMLRDLITEHEGINTRLRNVWQQQSDLEEEYTKLVEQQLGN